MKKILIPTDFSRNALMAAKYAAALFAGETGTFYLLHAEQGNTPGTGKQGILYRTVSETEEKMEKLRKKLSDADKNEQHDYKGEVYYDSLVGAVGWAILAKDIHYVFMGMKGMTAAERVFIGSNTMNVIRKIDFCPVVIIPPDPVSIPALPAGILFPTDFKRNYEQFELWPLTEMARIRKGEVVIMHIAEEECLNIDQSKHRKKLKKILKDIAYTEEEIVKNDNISTLIYRYAQREPVGMIAMINSKHGFLESFFREQVIRKIAFRVSVPFLILPEIT
ncbi:universal stress protein [Sinomicrobium pectinilyticum]|uniref:Universal stress protein n=1 Tax=Sinomicrobium pectinilyticum TaxID=1084421 RepID=A0A3N0DHY5_SINP1|nr:universal stress protein [Sinomicrobium pectinilyticum]RNL75290.1 universal stress protein [Sinomicrobium pectinilyticum]